MPFCTESTKRSSNEYQYIPYDVVSRNSSEFERYAACNILKWARQGQEALKLITFGTVLF